ncbi:MAG: ISAs1 family transposase [Clostridiales bacterium]|nr:ISAs1 family transposase [Clostridiales bacterium]
MNSFSKLQEKMKEIDKSSEHKGYYYKISDILTIMICGMLCNLQTIADIHEWAKAEPVRGFLLREFDIFKLPSRAQFYNIIGCVDPKKFNLVFTEWVKEVLSDNENTKIVSIDGKTICSTDQRNEDNQPLHILSAIDAESKLVLGSLPCKTKITEPEILRDLIKILDISGAIVVADALHCKKKSAKEVIGEGGDYLFVVKDNNPTLKEDVELYVKNEELEHFIQKELNGGRIEKRTAYTSTNIAWLPNKEEWENLKTIGAIHTEITKNNNTSSEWHYYISSRELTPKELLRYARSEWSIESMHWLLDVHFLEDKTKVWDMNVQQNLNIMRKIALNLAREYKKRFEPKKAISGILKRNLFDANNLAKFIRCFVALINVTDVLQN